MRPVRAQFLFWHHLIGDDGNRLREDIVNTEAIYRRGIGA